MHTDMISGMDACTPVSTNVLSDVPKIPVSSPTGNDKNTTPGEERSQAGFLVETIKKFPVPISFDDVGPVENPELYDPVPYFEKGTV